MFEPVFENLRKATETAIHTQQDLFKKWAALWPGVAVPQPAWGEPVQKFQKKWAEAVTEALGRQRETLEAQFNSGLKGLEAAFAVAGAKDPEEFKARTVELWQKSFDCLRQAFEAQAREFQVSVGRWAELMTKGS
jgi:hypothetical protein